jgi:oxygen-independent coproporphyrinogen-3 oxidase
MNLPPLSLYIHIPWCVRKCPYCDFNSHEVREPIDEMGYVAALLADLDEEMPLAGGRPLQSIFIGGGTPSLFGHEAVAALLLGVRERTDWVSGAEITLEANPGALEAAGFAGLRDAGVNRLSIGVQSFDAESLQALGRIHGPDEALRAVESAQRGGFERINLDLMFGLPVQTETQASRDLETAIGLEPDHLSYYQLTIEPNTPFSHRPPPLPDEDRLWRIQTAGRDRLQAAGFGQYEVSAFARAGAECRHNLNYWRFGDYIGIGAGAHGKLSDAEGVVLRRWKIRHPASYLRGAARGRALQGSRRLTPRDLGVEFMMNALRLREGVESELFPAATGLGLDAAAAGIAAAKDRGLLIADEKRLCATPLGFRFLSDLLALF